MINEWFSERTLNRQVAAEIARCHEAKDYRPTVVAAVQNKEGQFILVRHPSGSEFFPQGGIEKGESLTQALRRELKEETGLNKMRKIRCLFTQKMPYLSGRSERDGFKTGKKYFVCTGEVSGIGLFYYAVGELSGAKWVERGELEQAAEKNMVREKAELVYAILRYGSKNYLT